MAQPSHREAVAGRHAVLEALRSGREVHSVLVVHDAKDPEGVREAATVRGVTVRFLGSHELTTLVGTAHHRGFGAFVAPMADSSVRSLVEAARAKGEEPFLVALDGVEDVGNLGAVARSALLAGAHGLILPERGNASVTEGARKAASGAFSRLPVAAVSSLGSALAALRRDGVWVIGADARGGKAPWSLDLAKACCIVLGSENEGLSKATLEQLDARVCIPTPGGELSLNVSAAAAVLCFERVRQVAARRGR